jgi:hypothetical protein
MFHQTSISVLGGTGVPTVIYHEHDELPADLLESWFIEEQNWPEDTADELILEYSFAMGLLLDYKK